MRGIGGREERILRGECYGINFKNVGGSLLLEVIRSHGDGWKFQKRRKNKYTDADIEDGRSLCVCRDSSLSTNQ